MTGTPTSWFEDWRKSPVIPPCTGRCRGADRPMWESPAKFGRTGEGKRVVWCPCHQGVLRRLSPEERSLAIAEGRFDKSVTPAGAMFYADDKCGYDVVTVQELKAKD